MPETAPAISSTRVRSTKQYQYNICGKSFDSAETFDSHQRFEHSEPGILNPCLSRLIDTMYKNNHRHNQVNQIVIEQKRQNTSTKMAFGYSDLYSSILSDLIQQHQ